MKALQVLKQFSGFSSGEAVAREVVLGDGEKHTLHFKQVTDLEFRRYLNAQRSEDSEERLQALSQLIASSLVNEDGTPGITKEDAYRLKPRVSTALFAAVIDVAEITPKAQAEAGNVSLSVVKTGSGTSSLSDLAEEPSKSGSDESVVQNSSNGASSTNSAPSTTCTDSTDQRPGSLEA